MLTEGTDVFADKPRKFETIIATVLQHVWFY